MSETFPTADTIVERSDLGDGDAALWSYWNGQEEIAEKVEHQWTLIGRRTVLRYRDERPLANAQHRFNILWSNVQTLLPTLYARTPKPDVQRRFRDEDDTGRLASTLLERSLSFSLDTGPFDDVMRAAVLDKLLPGRGVARVLYIPHYGDKLDEAGETGPDAYNEAFEERGDAAVVVASDGDEGEAREVVYEETLPHYVFWEDYREGPARTWQEVPWIRYRAYMDRAQLIDRFGKDIGKKIKLDYSPKGTTANSREDDAPPDIYKKAIIHEVWDRTKKEVVWYAPGTPDLILDRVDDPLGLPEFFPSPDPLLATTTNNSRVPVPDYMEYKDQAVELDRLTARIDKLTQAMKVAGVYPGEQKQALAQLIGPGENVLIPILDWVPFIDKGGIKDIIQYLPIETIAACLLRLYDARDRIKAMIYEITGIGDIMRGQTQTNETATAQRLKTNFITRRVIPQQQEVARFARDIIRLMAGVIAGQFTASTISQITGYPQLCPVPQLPPPPPQFLPAPPVPMQGGPGNVVPFPGQGAPPSQPGMMLGGPPPPGMMPGQGGPPPGMAPTPMPPPQQPNPAFAEWQKQLQQVQQITAENAQKQQQFDAAVALLKKDGLQGFRLDIEADSTIAPDEEAEKQSRVEFLAQIVPLLEQVVPMAQGNPALSALAREMVLFGVRGFRVARPLEETIEKAFDAIAQMPPNPKATGQDKGKAGPDPQLEAAKVGADLQTAQSKAETDRLAIAQKQQQAMLTNQLGQQKLEVEQQKAAAELAMNMREQEQQNQHAQMRLAAAAFKGVA